jgi:hypothetical protein
MRMITWSTVAFSRCLLTATVTATMQVLHEANDAVVVVLDQVAFL